MKKYSAITYSAIAGIVAGCIVAVLVFSLNMPLFYSRPGEAIEFSLTNLPIVVVLYQIIPVMSLSYLAGNSRKEITFTSCIMVVLAWELLFLIFWYRHSIFSGDTFSYWRFKKDFLAILVIMLATALGFWKMWARIKPN